MPKTASPFRYPGGKTAMAPFLARFIQANKLNGCVYAEPFAGGAGAALRLLLDGVVSYIVLNDKDNRIYAVWNAILHKYSHFVKRINSAKITIDEWHKQHDIYTSAEDTDTSIEVAFATFFLNRCNRSGIIKGGVIGGFEQTGTDKIDCRFKKDSLIDTITAIHDRRSRIEIYNKDASDFIREFSDNIKESGFLYLDPPYFNKGKSLYLNYYNRNDHEALAKLISSTDKTKWLVSYDDTPEIENIYEKLGYPSSRQTLHYSLRDVRDSTEILIKSKECVWPTV